MYLPQYPSFLASINHNLLYISHNSPYINNSTYVGHDCAFKVLSVRLKVNMEDTAA